MGRKSLIKIRKACAPNSGATVSLIKIVSGVTVCQCSKHCLLLLLLVALGPNDTTYCFQAGRSNQLLHSADQK